MRTTARRPARSSLGTTQCFRSIGGILFAGPDLTPQNVTNGLQATRHALRRQRADSDPRPALVGAGEGKYGFIVDAVEWRWRQEFTSPPPESKAEGWVE